MNRRTAKKQHCGEYLELGFSVDAELSPGLSIEKLDNFLNEFCDFVREQRMFFGGGANNIDNTFSMFLTSSILKPGSVKYYQSVTPEQRTKVMEWCQGRSEIQRLQVGDLKDSWRKFSRRELDKSFADYMQGAQKLR